MEDEYPVSLCVDLFPDDSLILLPGSITITRTTFSVFKLCEARDEEPLFIGVSSVPLLRFVRKRSDLHPFTDAIVLMSTSDQLFINASLTAGLMVSRENGMAGKDSTSTGVYPLTSTDGRRSTDQLHLLDNPTLWTRLRLEFPSKEACSRCIEALLARHAEDLTSRYSIDQAMYPEEPSPKTRSCRRSESQISYTSLRDRENNGTGVGTKSPSATAPMDPSQRANTCRSTVQGYEASRGSSITHQLANRPFNRPIGSRRELETVSDIRTPRTPREQGRNFATGNQLQNSRREVLTPRDSLDSRKTPRGMPVRSNPSNSRRERETVSDVPTPKRSLRENLQDSPSERRSAYELPNEGIRSRVVPGSDYFGPNGNRINRSGREITAAALNTNATSAVLQDKSQSRYSTGLPYGSTTAIPYSLPSDTGYTQNSRTNRSQHQFFLRNVMRLMHHRLHLMQYLHKALVHQAYLVEEARLLGGRRRGRSSRGASMSQSASRLASLSPRSPRRTMISSVADESSRLREIEGRLREVEELHRDAERDRQEVSRLRRELERKLDLASRGSASARHRVSPSRNVSESNGFEASIHSISARDNNINKSSEFIQPSRHSKMRGSVGSHGSRVSTSMSRSGQIAIVPSAMPFLPVEGPSETEFSLAILDRYIFGDEWHLLYPERESDIRFNAVVDICLAHKLPRRLVNITAISVDQPGLRFTAEIYHDNEVLPRDVLQRRFANQPFSFLQRLYELRHHLASEELPTSQVPRSVRRGSPAGFRATNSQAARQVSSLYPRWAVEDYMAFGSDCDVIGDSMMEIESKLQEQQRRAEEHERQYNYDLLRDRGRKQSALMRERMLQQLGKLEQDESFWRSRIALSEAQDRQALTVEKFPKDQIASRMTTNALEEEEQVERAKMEVGYARQAQTLAQAHRRGLAFVRVVIQEAERRARLSEQEHAARIGLKMMTGSQRLLGATSQPEVDERARRKRLITAEAVQRENICNNIRAFLLEAVRDEMEALIGDEKTSRVVLAADEMKERIDILCCDDASTGNIALRTQGVIPSITPQAWQALRAEESAERVHIGNDELRRRHMFQRECTVMTEDRRRNEIELSEMDEHIEVLDYILQRNRALLELRRQERQHMMKLVNEEQYYRKGVLSDERDDWEALMELFDSELHDVLLAESAWLSPEPDLESPQRRRRVAGTPRQTKAFHYMTFSPEDMDHPPTAALAIEGILGCSINKNLEVTSIARPLPKVTEDELQFQAGDMILDVAGYSLHSLSHLREVLASRTMQIQHEAFEEFPDLVEEELTINPALQKYLDVLCEHHNFLVQVLRGCDIFQIIVRS